VFGIARHVYAAHCEAYGQQQDRLRRLAGRRDLEPDQVEELLDRIDAERAGRDLVSGLGTLTDRDRALVELVDKVTPPAVAGKGHQITGISRSPNGTITVNAHGIPAGDIIVIGVATSGHTSYSVGTWPRPRRRAA
jgi:hypothetical protein